MDIDIEKFKNDSTKMKINYSNTKKSLYKILNTNFCSKITRIRLYSNVFLLDEKYSLLNSNIKVPIQNIKDYNTYYSMFTVLNELCDVTPDGFELYKDSNYYIKKTVKKDLDIKEILDSNDNIEKINKSSELYELYDDLKYSDSFKCNSFGNLLEYIVGVTIPIKFALYIKIIAKYLNPDIEESKISDKNLPFLTILDLDNSITNDEKQVVLNLIKILMIIQFKYSKSFYNDIYEIPYYQENIDLVKSIQSKMTSLFLKLEKLLKEFDSINSNKLAQYIFASGNYNFLSSLLPFAKVSYKNNKNIFSDYKNFEYDIYDDNFNINHLNSLKRYIKPIIFNIGLIDEYNRISINIDTIFKKILEKNEVEIFQNIIDSNNVNERNSLLIKLLYINKNDLKVKENIKHYRNVVNITTSKEEELKNLFHKSEIESKCPKIRDNYESILNISKQFYDNAINITSYTPYFSTYPINIDNLGFESGYTTGPTKQIMYNLSNLLNYVVRFDNDNIKFVTPVWVEDNDKFYTFLSHYILIDLNLEISKIKFYLNFKMIITVFINIYEKNPKLFSEKCNFLRVISKFNKFLGISDIKSLFFENDKPKYENVPKEYEVYYNKICFFLIADLIDGGNEYKLLKNEESRSFILDPEANFLETKLESYKMPDRFLDFESFKIFYPKFTIDELYNIIEHKLFGMYFIINNNKEYTPEDIINNIIFKNNSGSDKYDILKKYLKNIITDYSKDLPDDIVKSIRDKYPDQKSFNEKILLAWTASINLTDSTELKFIVSPDVGEVLNIQTCFNTFYYPSSREIENVDQIKYEEFAIAFLQAINDVKFGITGGKKSRKKNKQKNIYNIKKTKKLLFKRKKFKNLNKSSVNKITKKIKIINKKTKKLNN